jgi:uncharacterized damage-inducible protein DinB
MDPWLQGPREGVDPYLMPVAHTLVQVRDDLPGVLAGLSPDELWRRPGGAASVGFHVRHLAGSLDRLLTYARGEALDDRQREALRVEPDDGGGASPEAVLARALEALDRALAQVAATPAAALLEPRAVGRAALPSTVLGLLFHAAEHAQRHLGQAVTTARIVRAGA